MNKPTVMVLDVERIPDELKSTANFVLWKVGATKADGRIAKIPLDPRTLMPASAHDPSNWLVFADAVAAYRREDASGVGLVLNGKPIQIEGAPYFLCCLDLDNFPPEEAEALYLRLGKPWTERSVSGTGFHLWCLSREKFRSGNAGGGRECYFENRFMVLTGTEAIGSLGDATDALREVLAEWWPDTGSGVRSSGLAALEGARRGVDDLTIRLAGAVQSPETPEEVSRVREMLRYVDADCDYEQWRNLCWAILSTEWECAEQLARDWSESCPDRFDERAFNQLVSSFQPERGVSLGTLAYWAKQGGWKPAVTGRENTIPNGSEVVDSPCDFEDVRNARVFAHQWRGKLLYVSTRNEWLRWDADRWQLSQGGEVIEAAKDVCKRLVDEAREVLAVDHARGKPLMAHAIASHKAHKLEAMVGLARSEPGMWVPEGLLDADPTLLGVGNGVVNLKTGELLENRPELYVSRFCNANYDTGAGCVRWAGFLNEVFKGDAETIDAVQRLLGYTLTGLVTEEIMVIAYGHGANGKSVFGNVVHSIMGGYSNVAASSLLVARAANDTGPRDDLAALAGARLVSINELQSGDRLDERAVKVLAGREPITARHLYSKPITFNPTFTPWLRTNHKPIIHGTDLGIWRRIVLLPFTRQFEEHERDPYLEEKLHAERDGILAWMVEGAVKYLRDGLKISPTMKAEQTSYRKESDLLGEFLQDATQPDPNTKVDQGLLYEGWRGWCQTNGVQYGSKATFTRRLKERGFTEVRSNGRRFYGGIALTQRR